jgi:hypothetical protein
MYVIGLFNWEEKKPAEISYDMGKLGLDKSKTYAAFDFWANKFVEPLSGTLKQSLPGGTCRILAVREQADRPVLVSTSRHITQGLVDVVEEKWDAGSKTLSGKSKVVAGDLYELRIYLPDAKWKIKSAKAGAKDMKASEKGDRVSITPEESGAIEWSVKF